MGFDDMDNPIEDFNWAHNGEGYVDVLKSGMDMAAGHLQRVIIRLARIEIDPDKLKATGGQK